MPPGRGLATPGIDPKSIVALVFIWQWCTRKYEAKTKMNPRVRLGCRGCRCACHVLLSKRLVETQNFERRKRKIANKSLKKLKGYQISIPTVTVKAKESLVYVSEAFI